jgi:hypothetical protein
MTQRPKVVEVDLIVTRKYRTSMTVSSIDMDDMTSSELISENFDIDTADLEDLEEDTYEIDDWQITFEDW